MVTINVNIKGVTCTIKWLASRVFVTHSRDNTLPTSS